MLIELTMKPDSCFDKYFQTFQGHCHAPAASFLGRELIAWVAVRFAMFKQPFQRSWDAAMGRGRWCPSGTEGDGQINVFYKWEHFLSMLDKYPVGFLEVNAMLGSFSCDRNYFPYYPLIWKKLLMIHFSRTWWWLCPLLHFAPIILHMLSTHLFWKETLTHLKCGQKIAGAQAYQAWKALHGFAMLFTANFALGQWIRWIINKHLETLGARYLSTL